MVKKITQDQVVQDNLWQNTIDSTKQLIGLIDTLNKELSETTKITKDALGKTNANNFEGLKDANEEVEKLNKAFEDKLKLDKQRVTLQNKLNSIEDETSKNLSELEVKTKKLTAAKNDLIKRQVQSDKQRRAGNEEIADAIKLTKEEEEELSNLTQELTVANLRKAESTKLNKEQIKEAIGLTDEYQRQSKRLNTLRKELKSLILLEGGSAESTKKLAKEVQNLDKRLKSVDAVAGQFQREVGNYEKGIDKATISTEDFSEELEDASGSLSDTATNILKVATAALSVKVAFDAVKTSIDATTEGSEDLRKANAASEGVLNTLKGSLASFTVGISQAVTNGIDLFTNGSQGLLETFSGIVGGLEKAEGSFEGFTDRAKAAAEAEILAAQAAIDYEKILRVLDQRLSIVNGTIEQQAAIAGDSTRSFNEITKAAIAAQAAQTERASIQIQIAQEELKITRLLIDAQEKAGTSSIELLNRESEGVVALQDARNQAAVERIETDKLLRQTNQDRLEIELDILIDGFDNQKTINERRISNEKETLDKRAALLEQTNKLAEDSFKGQKEVLEQLSAAGLDVDDLLLLDATALSKQIQQLEQSEIINTRTLEVIRERRIVLQDLEDAQSDLNDSQQEGIDIQNDLLAQEEALGKQTSENLQQNEFSNEELEQTRFENQKNSLERRLKLTKEGSIEQLRLQQELNDLLLEENNRKSKEEEERRKEDLEKEIENRKKVLTTLKALNDKFFNDKLKQTDEEIDSTKKREDELKNLAAQGNVDSAASLGQNQKDQAEATRKKEELLQKEKQFELALAVIAAFNTELDAGKSTGEALTSAITSTSVLTSFVSSLPSFFDGTTDTGNNGSLDSNGGHMAMLHDNERVVDKKNNSKMGGISNDFAADIVHDFNNDLLSYNTPQLTVQQTNWESNEQVLQKFDELKKDIVGAINNKETYLGSDIDTMKKLILQDYQKGGTRTTIKSKYPTRR
jgi:hypothetical protein